MKNKKDDIDWLEVAKIKTYGKTAKHGLTEDELKHYFGDLVMKSFGTYLDGQTCVLLPDGRAIIYPEDIEHFTRWISFPGQDFTD